MANVCQKSSSVDVDKKVVIVDVNCKTLVNANNKKNLVDIDKKIAMIDVGQNTLDNIDK